MTGTPSNDLERALRTYLARPKRRRSRWRWLLLPWHLLAATWGFFAGTWKDCPACRKDAK